MNRDDAMVFLRAGLIALFVVLSGAAYAGDKPSAWFCLKAKAAVLAAGSERAAEDAARAQGVSEATIAKAKRCK